MAFRLPRDPEAFSLDKPQKRSQRAKADAGHLSYIRRLPCCVCGSWRDVEASHVRYADPNYGKRSTAMAQKPDDKWTVPLCVTHHRTGPDAQHNSNEKSWWQRQGIDPCNLAIELYEVSGNEQFGLEAIQRRRRRSR